MIDIVFKLNDLGIYLHGQSYGPGDKKTTCPRCSDTRRDKKDPCLSLRIDEDGNNAVWMCHHCDWRGNTKDVHRDPVRRHRTHSPPPAPPVAPQLTDEVAEWFQRRGIPSSFLGRIGRVDHYIAKLGRKVPCIAFPYLRNGEVVNVKYRALDEKAFSQQKGGAQVFYGIDEIGLGEYEHENTLIIVEGEIDQLSGVVCGLTNVVSVPDGAPAHLRDKPSAEDPKFEYLRNDADKIEVFHKFVIAVDNDGPGDVLAEELARRLGKEKCYRVRWPDSADSPCKDMNETLMAHGPEVVRECILNAEPYPIQGYHRWNRSALHERRALGRERGVKTGWSNLDEHMTVAPGQLTVVTGVPNHGKSEFLDALIVNLAMRHEWRFALCSFENSITEHEQKIAEKYLGVPFWDGHSRSGMSTAEIDKASDWGEKYFTFIRMTKDEEPTIEWVLEKARAAVLRDGINGLVIDPYNELEHTRPQNMTETEYVSKMLGKVKHFAQNHGIHIWYVAHPAKMKRENGKMPEPTLYDISGSANWANKADVGIVVHRDFDVDAVTLHIQKVRHKWIGKPGRVTLNYDRVTGRFSEPTPPTHWSDR